MHDEETGEWLDFIFNEGRTRVPARISRAALAAHFGATDDGASLVGVYVQNAEVIHRQVKAKMRAGAKPTAEKPLELRAADFVPPRPHGLTPAPAPATQKPPVVRFHCV